MTCHFPNCHSPTKESIVTTSTYTVSGMTCQHCVTAVTEEIGRIPGVRSVEVSLDAGKVAVRSDDALDPAAVAAAVDEAGYEVVGATAG